MSMTTQQTLVVTLGAAYIADLANTLGGLPYWIAVVICAFSFGLAGRSLKRIIRRR